MEYGSNEQIFGTLFHVVPSESMPRDPHTVLDRIHKSNALSLPKTGIYDPLRGKENISEMTFDVLHRTKLEDFERRVQLWMSNDFAALRARYFLTAKNVLIQIQMVQEESPWNIPRAVVTHMQGVRPTQEDTHIWGEIRCGSSVFPFFAICDGHAGGYASKFVQANLKDILEDVFQKAFPEGSIPNAITSDIALENALMMIGPLAEEALAKDRVVQQSLASQLDLSGGTTLACAICINGSVWVANVGDSRVLAVDSQGTHQLTEDASVDNLYFRQGVEKRGGHAVWDLNDQVFRVDGLAVARSIGDCIPGISARAVVTKYQIPKDGTTLVLGCDGLFDTVSSEDVGCIVAKGRKQSLRDVTELLVQSAFADGSQDNISALVARIDE